MGLIAAPHTPFRPDGTVALDTIPLQARLLDHNAVAGAFICGTTGEGSSLTAEERRRIAEAWLAARPAGLAVIVHVGHPSFLEACAFARHAQDIGANAVAAMAPSFFKPTGVAELVGYCAEIAAAAPRLPFYYYHMPAMTGVHFAAADFLKAADGRIPNLAGVKFTHENLMDFRLAAEVKGGRYDLLFGRDEILLSGIALGARGAVGSTYNFAAPLYHRILKSFAAGHIDAARADQLRSMQCIEVLNQFGGLSAGKAVMKLIGVDCGPVRLPLRAVPPADEAKLRAALERVGFFEYASVLAG